MKRLGDILYIMDKLLIVRAERTLEQSVFRGDQTVVTRKMKKIGKINEVFGPVNAPYISIKIFNNINASEVKGLKKERAYLQ